MRGYSNDILNLLYERKVVIYGTGDIAVGVLSILLRNGVKPVLFLNREGVNSNPVLEGYKTVCISDLPDNCDSVIAIVSEEIDNPDVYDALEKHKVGAVITYDLIVSLDRNRLSYSQSGEDMLVYYFFHQIVGKDEITYLDLGANDPVMLSNTFYFYENGSKGILVEPNTNLTDRAEMLRPRDKIINAGVGNKEGTLDYYMFDAHTLNTCSQKEAEECEKLGHTIIGTKQIPIIHVNKLLEEQGHTDFLSLDVEGIDFDILKAIDYDEFAPTCICIETLEYMGEKRDDNEEICEFLKDKGYTVFADTFINTIFVLKDVLDGAMEAKRKLRKS